MNRTARRTLPIVTVAALAIGGVAAIAQARADEPAPQPPLTASAPPPSALPASPGGELTRGPMLPTSVPTALDIPALKVTVPLTGLGRQADGSMQVPTDEKTVGWYKLAPTPGSLGPAVLAGHVNYHGRNGTFARLSTLRPGDQVRVSRADGRTAVFAVTRVDRYAKDKFPSDAVYGPINYAGLRLITCGGDFDSRSGHYEDNIVAYADLVSG